MEIRTLTIEERLGKQYSEHLVFKRLKEFAEFHESLSFLILGTVSSGITSMIDFDTYFYSSMQGTLESICQILTKGRISDAYALLRKYYDLSIINIYTNLYLEDNCKIDSWVVTKIDNWIKGEGTIPEYRVMSKYIKESAKLAPITRLLEKDNRYKIIRKRCNDNMHYNFYYNLLLNDNEIHLETRIKHLDILLNDIENIFIQHFAYIFYLKQHYMSSSDYVDCLDIGIEPQEGSQYWVSPFIQNMFNDLIKQKRPDIANEIKETTTMELE